MSSSSSKETNAGAAARCVACLGSSCSGTSRAQHSRVQQSTAKEDWPGCRIKRVSGRVIFHASTTTYAYKA